MEILIAPLGLTDYLCAWRTQQRTHARCQETGENILLVTEHHPVVTFGYRRQADHLRLSRAELAKKGIPLVESTRGGSNVPRSGTAHRVSAARHETQRTYRAAAG